MAVELARTEIARFLADATPEVLCFKGKWGTGQTYSWETLVKEASKADSGLAWDDYAYVSLFGIGSIEDLKTAIFESTIPKRLIGVPPSIDTALDHAKSLGRRGLSKAPVVLKRVPGLGQVLEGSEGIYKVTLLWA